MAAFGLGKLRDVKNTMICMLRIEMFCGFLEQIGFVLRTCELFDNSETIKTTQSRNKFVMAHLALMSRLLVCLCMQIFSVTSVAAAQNWNIFICIYVCVYTEVFETGYKDKMLLWSK